MEVRYACQPFLKEDAHLQAREQGAEASMGSPAKGRVANVLAVKVDRLRVREAPWILAMQHALDQHPLVLLERHTVIDGVAGHDARCGRCAVIAQQFVDGARNESG